MRYLILSDIHGNRQGLEAALADAAGKYEEILCLGDIVGYGGDPKHVLDWTRANVKTICRGNHDKAAAGLDDLEWFNPVARTSALWTREILGPESVQYLYDLPKGPLRVQDFEILHGSPSDEDEYLISIQDAAHNAPFLNALVTFFGHTHVQGGFLVHRSGVKRIPKVHPNSSGADLEIEPDRAYLINPGSVGQPRDGDPRCGYAIYDSDRRYVAFRRVPYDIRGAQQAILDAGLPPLLADRLAQGL
ncbi:MAG: metallophosphatase family protein [Bryobacteraceae bacterium]|nr:metallophosphatase family protein [Bryobacteraceae bacterium]